MKMVSKKSVNILVLSMAVLVMTSFTTSAQEWSRSGKGELFGSLQSMSGDTTNLGSIMMEVDDSTVFGIGYGYNLNDHLNFNGDLLIGSTDITGSEGSIVINGDSTLTVMDLNLDCNLLKSKFTPMISGGIGYINFNGDFSGFDFNETDFSYNLAIGFRWDVSDHWLLKGGYKATWTEIQDTDDQIMLDGLSLSAGYVF
ncbi:MAG: porin family protein [Desulfobacteraceae bacterium]|nr:porin family protein [Desulfobacteraceae bacterium]MBU4002007.1 porin family protein [Pseudomonadota bacterium]